MKKRTQIFFVLCIGYSISILGAQDPSPDYTPCEQCTEYKNTLFLLSDIIERDQETSFALSEQVENFKAIHLKQQQKIRQLEDQIQYLEAKNNTGPV